ncbi:MAG: NADH-quinone oxidoreductase subunit H, partial [Catenulispora sp.]
MTVTDAAVRLAIILGFFLVVPLLVGQMEHKAMAHMQSRVGPMYAGAFHGWAQLVADGVKFAQKEDVVPAAADRRVFQLAPAVALIPYLVALVTIPIGPGTQVGRNLDAGLFFVLAVMGVGVLGSLMAGWASANKYSLLGGIRSAAQLMAYELPMILAAASVAMAAGTLSLTGIATAWHWYWVPWQLMGLFVFFTSGLAELQRPPFDMPVADSEIIFGAYTEYTGIRFALFLLAEYAGIVLLAPVAGGGGMAFDSDGMLVVGYGNTIQNGTTGDSSGPSGLYKVDPDTGKRTTYATGLSMANGVARAPDGAFYASNDAGHNIDKIV